MHATLDTERVWYICMSPKFISLRMLGNIAKVLETRIAVRQYILYV